MVEINKSSLNRLFETEGPNLLTLAGIEYEFVWPEPDVPALGGKRYIVINLSPNKYTILNARQFIIDQERGFFNAYAVWTGGTITGVVPAISTRADSLVPAGATINTISAPTTIDQNTLLLSEPIFGTPGQGNVIASGGVSSSDSWRILPPGLPFLIEAHNQSAEAAYMRVRLQWWEVSPGFILNSESI